MQALLNRVAVVAASRCFLRRRMLAAAALALLVAATLTSAGVFARAGLEPPPRLADTGLYANVATLQVDAEHLAFSPQYPLWTDGAEKRRWIALPPGSAIDASDPDAWTFPVGTRLWKEFSFGGRRIETRYMERQPDGRWLYAAYAWSEDGKETQLVGARGRRNAYALGGGRSHAIPGLADCKACHQGGRSEVLGFSAIQLAAAKDPGTLHADTPVPGADLKSLVARGWLAGLPASALEPSWPLASPTERAALGYLHGNCGHCHNPQGPLRNVGLYLRQVAGEQSKPAIASTFGHPVKQPAPGQSADAMLRIEPHHPERSALLQRMGSRYPALQMPPLGTALVDDEAVELIRRWIAGRAPDPQTTSRQR